MGATCTAHFQARALRKVLLPVSTCGTPGKAMHMAHTCIWAVAAARLVDESVLCCCRAPASAVRRAWTSPRRPPASLSRCCAYSAICSWATVRRLVACSASASAFRRALCSSAVHHLHLSRGLGRARNASTVAACAAVRMHNKNSAKYTTFNCQMIGSVAAGLMA